MKIQIMSDLHQEFHRDKRVLEKKDVVGDVLLLAGDINAGSRSPIDYLKEYGETYMILGNHEFYKRHWRHAVDDYKAMFAGSNVHILENQCVKVRDKFILIACTLWTDFMAPVPAGYTPAFGDVNGKEHQGFFCKQLMSDFDAIKGLTISGWEDRFKESVQFLKHFLSENKDKGLPVVVMTHHAPSFKSTHPHYEGSPMNGGFTVDLEYLIEEYQPSLWIHGHHHTSSDYYIGNTRILCNPMGYPGEKFSSFNKHLIVEL